MRKPTPYTNLRELLLSYARKRGWWTQRRIAMACQIEETALSRFLNGEQDLGARRTHALFRAVGIPMDDYDLAYELLARVQDEARTRRDARLARQILRPTKTPEADEPTGDVIGIGRVGEPGWKTGTIAVPVVGVRYLPPDSDLPMSEVLALFRAERYTSEQIAAFMGD